MKKKILIAGSREYDNYEEAEAVLDALVKDHVGECDIVILSGSCRGADMIGERYAEQHRFEIKRYPADWKRYGRAAGSIRNEEMVRAADMVICFWDGESRGSRSLIKSVERLGKEISVVDI